MKLRGKLAVLSQDGQVLSAAWGAVRSERVEIEGWVVAERPGDIDANNAPAAGEWFGKVLRDAGCSTRACVIGVPRASVVLKRMAFPALRDAAEGDLAGMVQLQMARQLTMPLQGAAIDFVRLGVENREAPAAPESTEVLAAALPGENVTWCREFAKSAGLRLRSVALLGEGSAALLALLSYTQGGPILGVSVTPRGVELAIISDGRVVFSRAIDIGPPPGVEGWAAFGERVAVEAKRTRVGYRGVGESEDLVCIAVIGEDSLAASVGKTLGRELDLPWQAVRFPHAVAVPAGMDSATRAGLAPLIGLMLGAALDRPTYDFANPREAPDTSAPIRQAALAAVLGLIIFGGAGYLVGSQRMDALKSRVETAHDTAFELEEQYIRQLRTDARLQHIQKLREGGADWVKHLAYLSSAMPPADQARLELIAGTLTAATTFEGKSLQEGQWLANRRVEFSLAGIASREVANDFRGKLVMSKIYQAGTRGADVSDKFVYQLTTTVSSPDEVLREESTRKEEGS